MKACLIGLSVLVCCFGSIFALEVFEQKTIRARVGDLVTLPLEPLAGGTWEHRLITPALLSIISNRYLEDRIELVVRMQAEGTGRIETVRIVSNRVVLRKYFFMQIAKRESGISPTNESAMTNDQTEARDAKESADQRDYLYAVRVYEEGEYDEAIHALDIFVRRYPRSPMLGMARLYSGQARFALGRYDQAVIDFKAASASQDERTRLLASMWTGNGLEALERLDEAVMAFMNAMSPQYPDIDIRARTGLAVTYGRRGKIALAEGQFRRIFRLYAATKEQNAGYLPALYHAASFYDRNAKDAEAAVRYYLEYIDLASKLLAKSNPPSSQEGSIRRQLAEVRTRMAWLKQNYTDYR